MRGCVPVELVGKGQPLGARASRPHKPWHSLANRSHFDQPGKEKDFSTKGLEEAREGPAKGRERGKISTKELLSPLWRRQP